MQAVRSRIVIASLQICLGVQLHLEFGADNIDHNTQTLDGLKTFHGIGMIKAVTPGIKCT